MAQTIVLDVVDVRELLAYLQHEWVTRGNPQEAYDHMLQALQAYDDEMAQLQQPLLPLDGTTDDA